MPDNLNDLNGVGIKFKEICKTYGDSIKAGTSYYHERIKDEIDTLTKLLALQKQVAKLSNSSIADALMVTLRNKAPMQIEPASEFTRNCLEEAINDLASGMDPVDMLAKFDSLYL